MAWWIRGEDCDDGNRHGAEQIDVIGVTGPVSMALLFWNGPTSSNDAS